MAGLVGNGDAKLRAACIGAHTSVVGQGRVGAQTPARPALLYFGLGPFPFP